MIGFPLRTASAYWRRGIKGEDNHSSNWIQFNSVQSFLITLVQNSRCKSESHLKMNKIFLVEDELALAEAVVLNLELEGYTVTHISNGGTAMEQLQNLGSADLVILDIMLPVVNGINICKKLREISDVPVLFLSAKGTTADKIEGLKSGGTDYLSKPFDLEELLLRIQILMSRTVKKPLETIVTIGQKSVDFKTYSVKDLRTSDEVTLSKREIALLQLFMKKEGDVVSRDEILDEVWGKDQFPTSRTIDNFILSFRKLFEPNPKEPIYFHSIRGVGYRFTNA